MSNESLRIGQRETLRYDMNCNPLGVPESATRAIMANIESIGHYPDAYYEPLKHAIASYAGCSPERLVLGSGSSDLLRLFVALLAPKHALLPVPSAAEYENVLRIYGCEIDFYEFDESADFRPDIDDFIAHLTDGHDMVILGNPNNPTSQLISVDDLTRIADRCREIGAFLLIDEMYIEFTEHYEANTAIALTKSYENLAVLRSISKFFAVPGLRLAYAACGSDTDLAIINMTATPNSISCLTAAACTAMLEDSGYARRSRSAIFTERNLIVSAMRANKNLRLYKPSANFILMKILKEGITAQDLSEQCRQEGIILRSCASFRGLDHTYVRFAILNPVQNDLMVNTILAALR